MRSHPVYGQGQLKEMGEEEEDGADFLQWLDPDTSAIVFTLLHHPADLARASAVSRSWRTFGLPSVHPHSYCPDTDMEYCTMIRSLSF